MSFPMNFFPYYDDKRNLKPQIMAARRAALRAALRGEAIPPDLDDPVAMACLIRGLHKHPLFAVGRDVDRLCEVNPRAARARNARLIMSNIIPEHMPADERPYCIWAPDLASEDTYRKLARRYPEMRYLVGRACAVAGYSVLYEELDLLPDVSIAEEARESDHERSKLIYKSIMGNGVGKLLYRILHDCDRSVSIEEPLFPAYLNGDTYIRRYLDTRWQTPEHYDDMTGDRTIEEDGGIDEETYYPPSTDGKDVRDMTDIEAKLLHEPLPAHLPTLETGQLIQMAAFDGNIDRYDRLKCPLSQICHNELLCIIRGIYHHTMFARWWNDQIAMETPRARSVAKGARNRFGRRADCVGAIRMAVIARRIMLNEVDDIRENGWPADTPFPLLIWWPLRPRSMTLNALNEKVPEMRVAAAIAAVVINEEHTYHSIMKNLSPEKAVNWRIEEAINRSPNRSLHDDFERRKAQARERGVRISHGGDFNPDNWLREADLEPTQPYLSVPELGMPAWICATEYGLGPYFDGEGPDAWETEFRVMMGRKRPFSTADAEA